MWFIAPAVDAESWVWWLVFEIIRRIAEVKANERRKALEEILYALVVQKFMDAHVSFFFLVFFFLIILFLLFFSFLPYYIFFLIFFLLWIECFLWFDYLYNDHDNFSYCFFLFMILYKNLFFYDFSWQFNYWNCFDNNVDNNFNWYGNDDDNKIGIRFSIYVIIFLLMEN